MNASSGGFVKVPQTWLKSIVLGLNADSHLRTRVDNISKELAIPVFTAVMNKKEYKIDIPGLKIDGIRGKRQYDDVIKSGKFEL